MKTVVEIHVDDNPESPREWDNLGTMVCWHRRYNLGDEQPSCDPNEYLADLPKGTIILPLYLIDHSGISMSTSDFNDPWDSGQVGFIYITREKAREELGISRVTEKQRKRIEGYLRNEVETYDAFLRGNVYGYVIKEVEECESCGTDEETEIDSCWGFYGDYIELNGILDHIPAELHSAAREAWLNPIY